MAKIENIKELRGFVRGLGEFTVKRGHKTLYGLINTDGKIVLDPQPKAIGIYDEKTVLLSDKGKMWSGTTVLNLEDGTECSREYFYAKKNGLVITYQRGKGQGAIDVDGNVVIPHKYRYLCCDDSFNLYFARNRKNKCGILNSRGEEVLPFEYDDIAFADLGYEDSVVADRIGVKQGANWFIVDSSGRRLSANRYDKLEQFTPNGYAIFGEKIHEEMYYGVIDANENIVIPAKYSGSLKYGIGWLDNYADGWTKLVVPKECIGVKEVLTLTGDNALPRGYGDICDYYQGAYVVRPCGESFSQNYGVITEDGKEILPFEFFSIHLRSKNFYLACRRDTTESDYGSLNYGLYSLNGELVLPCEYYWIDVCTDIDRIAVCKNGEWYYVNRHGERVLL